MLQLIRQTVGSQSTVRSRRDSLMTSGEPTSVISLSHFSVMEEEKRQSCYEGSFAEDFRFYLKQTKVHEVHLCFFQKILPSTFKRIAAGQSNLDVLGVGSGEGELDVGLLHMLQAAAPDASITAEVVEGSAAFAQIFKALVANNQDLQQIPFTWHVMRHEDYERQVQAQKHPKKFDFIHLIEVVYYLDNLADVIRFYHSLLKENGRLMIILEADGSGTDILWTTFGAELCANGRAKNYAAKDIIGLVRNMGLECEEFISPCNIDVTECFTPDSRNGERLLGIVAERDHFNQSFTAEIRQGMLDLMKNKCSTEKDGRILLNNDFSCIIIHA